MKTRDIMQRKPITATPEMSIEDAVHLMTTHRISGLPVVDPTGVVVGVLSEGDLLRRMEPGTEARLPGWRAWLASQGHTARDYVRSHARRVGELMTAPVISVTPQTDLADVVALMESRRIKRVPHVRHSDRSATLERGGPIRSAAAMINVLFILNDAPVEPGRSLNGLRLAASMSVHSSVYIRVFLLGSGVACARKPHGMRECEDSAALLTSVIRHGGEVRICERCGDEHAAGAEELIEGVSPASLAELSRWIAEGDRLLVF